MKRRVLILFSAVLLSLLVVPTINMLLAPNRHAIKWKEKSFLYNMDFISRLAALILYPMGISTSPKKVIIGLDGWLYLGDEYGETRTVDRRPPSESDYVLGQKIGGAIKAWDVYLSNKGVKVFKVMMGPNKGTIYPENLPLWAKPATPNATDALLAGTGVVNYVDLRGALLAAKANYSVPLFYKTDTHWNSLGAGVAFQAFAQQVAKVEPEIQWPSSDAYQIICVNPRAGGDLANFLRLKADLVDLEPIIQISSLPKTATQIDFDTKKVLSQTGSPYKPVLIESPEALNKKKVLWLRDSFGDALLPLMASTFSEVLHIHWIEAIKPGGRIVQLVDDWKPDYVFITVVERASRDSEFGEYPPPLFDPHHE